MALGSINMQQVSVRLAEPQDARAIADIYNSAIEHSTVTYATSPVTVEDRLEWLNRLNEQNYPVVVATAQDEVCGFGALTPFHSVSGYRFTASGQIYIAEPFRGRGVGRAIVAKLPTLAKERDIHTVIAGINSKNEASIKLLKSIGFEQVGYFREIGRKGNEWLDDVCMQLIL